MPRKVDRCPQIRYDDYVLVNLGKLFLITKFAEA